MTTKPYGRFTSPTRLTNATKVMGATAKQWDEALTGDMENTLKLVKERMQAMDKSPDIAELDVRKIPSGDLASAIKRHKIPAAS